MKKFGEKRFTPRADDEKNILGDVPDAEIDRKLDAIEKTASGWQEAKPGVLADAEAAELNIAAEGITETDKPSWKEGGQEVIEGVSDAEIGAQVEAGLSEKTASGYTEGGAEQIAAADAAEIDRITAAIKEDKLEEIPLSEKGKVANPLEQLAKKKGPDTGDSEQEASAGE